MRKFIFVKKKTSYLLDDGAVGTINSLRWEERRTPVVSLLKGPIRTEGKLSGNWLRVPMKLETSSHICSKI